MPRSERLTRERVFSEAVALADHDGFESCTMRKLADRMGVGAMSLYHYVPSKEDLISGMVDIVFAEIEPPAVGGDWKAEMRRRAVSTREALNRHPWAVGLMEGRPRPGPASIRIREAILGCLREAGFSVGDTVQAYSVQDAYIYGFALQERSLGFEDTKASTKKAAQVTQELSAEEFPYLTEVVGGHVATAGYDAGEAFEFGLDLILDALEARRDA